MIASRPEEVNKFLNKNTDLDSIAEAVPDTFCRSTYQFPVPCPPLETARRFRTLLRKRGDMDRLPVNDQRGAGQAGRRQTQVLLARDRLKVSTNVSIGRALPAKIASIVPREINGSITRLSWVTVAPKATAESASATGDGCMRSTIRDGWDRGGHTSSQPVVRSPWSVIRGPRSTDPAWVCAEPWL